MTESAPASAFQDRQLQNLLESVSRKEHISKPKFTLTSGCKPGDNFIGRVYRAVIEETDESKPKRCLSLIFKASPLNKLRRQMLSSHLVFLTETQMYQEILPTLNKLLNQYGVVDTPIMPATARCFAAELSDGADPDMAQVLVLGDKSVEGFKMADRRVGLDAEHCRVILHKLALWHSASLALNHLQPETAAHFKKILHKNTWFTNAKHALLSDLKQGAVNSLDILQSPYKRGSPEYERLAKVIHNFENELVQVNDSNAACACINHGDCWTNNILFKYQKDGSLSDVCLIDLQLARVASPAVEVSYLLFLCTTKETRDESYDDLVRYYFDQVSSNLRRMECDSAKLFPWQRFRDSFKEHGRMGLLIAMTALPIFMADAADINLDVNSEEHEGSVFSGCAEITDPETREALSRRLTDVVADALRWGYI